MKTAFGVFRNDGDDGDLFHNDGDDGDDGDRSGGARRDSLLAQALWRTRGDLTAGFEGGMGSPAFATKHLAQDAFGRWSREVRGYLCSFELLSGLYFDSSDPDTARLHAVEMKSGGKNAPTVGKTSLVHALERPEFDTKPKAFEDQLSKVLSKTGLRSERMAEILTQLSVPYSFFGMLLNLQPGRHRHTFELMSVVFRLSSNVVMQFKHHLGVRRPSDRSPLVQPVLVVPGHGSFPAGHATQCHFVATVLKSLVGKKLGADLGGLLDDLAQRVAENRVVAGLHYEADNDAGKALGIALAQKYFDQRRKVEHSALKWLWGQAEKEWKNV